MSGSEPPARSRLADRAVTLVEAAGRRAARAGRSMGGSEPVDASASHGLVEHFSRKNLWGWVSVPPDSPATRVSLVLDDLEVTSTIASPESSGPSGGGPARGRGAGRRGGRPGPMAHLPGPGPERNTSEQIRWFRCRLDDLWRFCDTTTRVSVRVDGTALPITGHGMYLLPDRDGPASLEDLRERVGRGEVFSQKGKLQTSKQHDLAWQAGVLRLFEMTAQGLRETRGYDAFFVYGTLLGAAREGTYIGHDVDFDAAYVSGLTDPDLVAEELVNLALVLIERGLAVTCLPTHLHVSDPSEPDLHIDLFHTYFDAEGLLSLPFGVAGTSQVRREDWQGVRRIDWPGGTGIVPVNLEQVAEYLYGADWQQPKPGFHWPRDRTRTFPGALTTAQRSKVYWASFYAHHRYTSGSTFSELVDARPDTPSTVIDIGCGDGRDSCAFGTAGRTVLGLDQSPVGVQHAAARAEALGLTERVRFAVCDVADTEALDALLEEVLTSVGAEPVLFYLRFFLHSISAEVQEVLMDALAVRARAGDLIAAEFRTEADEAVSKVHGQHYRRYQDGHAFGGSLRERGFELLHEQEGTGLSTYRGEDPVLYRVIARRMSQDQDQD